MFYSPLRYPGGKNRLAKFIAHVCADNNISGHYIEPYAGGASVALYLLIERKVKKITINDYDRSIYAFWHSVLHNADRLCNLIVNTEVNTDNWRKAKNIQNNKDKSALLELGFATFFLNRTNRSGIMNAGCIGGIAQKGKYKINCRFNKNKLIRRIELITKYKKYITLYQEDAAILTKKLTQESDDKNTFFYFDPPYYLKGSSLYMNHYDDTQHAEIAEKIRSIKKSHWIVSYDDAAYVKKLYSWALSRQYSLKHFAYQAKTGKEILFYNKATKIPATEMADKKFNISHTDQTFSKQFHKG